MPKISIVIPCYNQGHFLKETLEGFLPENDEYEVIIVNDGSTLPDTIHALEQLEGRGYRIIQQENGGLASARNRGIGLSRGEFIMLLDADNKVEPTFLAEAVRIFENSPGVAVVYSDALYFGKKEGPWIVGDFNLQKMMIENYIDACAMVRKAVFDELGGYDTQMKQIKSGWEDWEMWLRLAFAGKEFRYWPHTGFHYRVNEDSMIGGINNSYEIRNKLTQYLHDKYPDKLGHQFITAYVKKRFKPHPFKFLVKLSMNTWFNNKYQRLVNQNKVMNGL